MYNPSSHKNAIAGFVNSPHVQHNCISLSFTPPDAKYVGTSTGAEGGKHTVSTQQHLRISMKTSHGTI
jgi:hypothetical protein